jgi:hypothetical protein
MRFRPFGRVVAQELPNGDRSPEIVATGRSVSIEKARKNSERIPRNGPELPRAQTRVQRSTGSAYQTKDRRGALGRIDAASLGVRDAGDEQNRCEESKPRETLHNG